MPKQQITRTLKLPEEPSKRKYVAIPKSVKNEIREMIRSGMKKSDVEARLQLENKIEGNINCWQWKRLMATRNEQQEILPTQQFRTKRNLATEEFKADCVSIFVEQSKKSKLGVDKLMLICQQVQKMEKYAANSEVQKLSISRGFTDNLFKNSQAYQSTVAENSSDLQNSKS